MCVRVSSHSLSPVCVYVCVCFWLIYALYYPLICEKVAFLFFFAKVVY